ncbi:response regulator [Lujinxingia sediminis]|uniref:histidine kinase n=1 Tax=Lujinxingia sediminis TaxID=2480984 RepID=A0ABY0CPN8_9DELT|nr:ATP-binding protein [Lujinxingia sediminis]RVU42424.1 response regulator [Lujinxingia sediminis]
MKHEQADAYARGGARLEALRRYCVLDTEPEEAFDRLARLAAQICEAPASTITLVDEERQWFKARLGVDLVQTGLEASFCKFVICGTEVMEVPDARDDARFKDIPTVVGGPKIRYYAGAPLVSPEGHRLGTICVFDSKPRSGLSEEQHLALRDLAGVVVDELELRRARQELGTHVEREEGLKQRLIARQERLDLALKASNLGWWEWGPGEDSLHVDARVAEQLGVEPGALSVEAFSACFAESSRSELANIFATHLQEERYARPRLLQVDREDDAGGELRRVVVYAVRSSRGGRMIGTLQDITEEHNSQREMERLERLAALGTMAAGVGHEINNPLAYILASMEFVQGMLAPQVKAESGQVSLARHDAAEVLSAIHDAHEGALRMRDIVRELRVLARDPQQTQPAEPIAMDESLNLALRMARIHLRGKGRIELQRGSNRQVLATRSGLTQVLLNILLNAVHAVAQRQPDTGSGRVLVRTFDRDAQVVVEIEDNGVGISQENLSRVFDPFFTTKGPDEGTGLGVPTSLRLVEHFGGSLELSSEEGRGTLVRVMLPAVEAPSVRGGAHSPSEEVRFHRVLVIDDEARLGKIFARLLRDRAEVVSVEGVEQARAALSVGDFDAIFCDLHLPVISGAAFFRELQKERPELAPRVVFMTGGLYSEEARALVNSGEHVVLYKPFDLAALRDALASVLAR